ncbi:MAG: protein kinase, partial [Pleurocapsa sp. SU_196_0]|nr:protein kinase [Pleurocapsa sp. SU_196_0]
MPDDLESTCLHCGSVNPPGASACHVCGASLEASVFLPRGERIGNFVLEDVLGRGGFGITYRARDVATGEIVALKELFPDGLAARERNGAVRIPDSAREEFEKHKSRFALEAQLLQRIQHPASTHFVALFAGNDTLYLAMEFVQGETLETRLQFRKKLGMKEARNLLRDILGVLEEVHDAGLLHRDIKPANIILQPTGAQLIDFGSGLAIEKNRTMQISQRLLTPAYAPLELYGANVRLSPASDLYSLAATIYEALTLKRPPSALERANGAPLKPLRKQRPDISKAFAQAIDAALEIRVDARPPSVNAFRKLLASGPPRKTRTVPPVPSARANPPRSTSNVTRASSRGAGSRGAGSRPVQGQPIAFRDNAIFTGATFVLVLAMALGIVLVFLEETRLGQRVLSSAAIGLMTGCVVFIGAWLLVQPVRWLEGRLVNRKRKPMSFYRQSMLGVYSFGAAQTFQFFSGNWNGFWSALPLTLFIGYVLLGLGFAFSNRASAPRALRPWTVVGLHLAIPCLIFGWFFNPFKVVFDPQPMSTTSSSQTAPPASSSPSTPVIVEPPPSSASFRVLTDTPIGGNKWVCQQHLGKPFSEAMLDGTYLIALDDESRSVATGLEPRLDAKALPCSDVANTVLKFTYQDVSTRQDRARAGEMIWQFVPLLETRLATVGNWLYSSG